MVKYFEMRGFYRIFIEEEASHGKQMRRKRILCI